MSSILSYGCRGVRKIQRKALKIPAELCGLEYEERIKVWATFKLSSKRVRDDLIHMYKVLNNLEKISWYRGRILASDHYEKRIFSGNQPSLVSEHFPSKLRNDFSNLGTVMHEFFTNQVID